MKRRICISLCVLVFAVAAMFFVFRLPAQAAEVIASGNCGRNVSWTLDDVGTLTISGTGDMENYLENRAVPWGYYIEQIRAVVIEDGVTSVGNHAFANGIFIEQIQLGSSLTRIGECAFANCNNLKQVEIPDSVEVLDDHSFEGCLWLSSVKMPANLQELGERAFALCRVLSKITLPENLTVIGSGAFCGCTELRSIEIPDGVASIGEQAFFGCESLVSVKLPAGLQQIGQLMFSGCDSLKSITIPNSVTSIEDSAFSGCMRLTSIVIPDSVTYMGVNVFQNCKALTDVTLSNGLKSISPFLFAGCESLVTIEIPYNVTRIGSAAFQNCENLAMVILPARLRLVEGSSFVDCVQLWHILYTGTEVLWNTANIQDYNHELKQATIHYNYDGSWTPDPNQRICLECCRMGNHNIPQGERVEPTCTEDGFVRGICSCCNEHVEMILPKTAHQYHLIPGTPVEAGDRCSVCGYVLMLTPELMLQGLLDKYVNGHVERFTEGVQQGIDRLAAIPGLQEGLKACACGVLLGLAVALVLIWRKRK